MTGYVLRRVGQSLVTLLLVSAVIFIILRLVGDPTHLMLPPEATEADRALLRTQLGLSDPIAVQYGGFLKSLVTGDLGQSYRFSRPALEIVLERIGPTLVLTTAALSLGIALGVPLGVAAAVRRDSWIGRLAGALAILGQAGPPFLFGLLMVRLFSVELRWLPTSGYGTLGHLVMPTMALGCYAAAGLMRLTRASVSDVLDADYVKLARIKGLSERRVIYKHVLSNALLPVITFAGLQLGILMGGAVSIEAIFAWPGMGKLILDSISGLDFTVVQAAVLVSALIFTAVNLVIDLLYAVIDPRIRYA